MADLTESPELCWDHLYVPQVDLEAHWKRRWDRLNDEIIRSEWRHQFVMDAMKVFLIMLVGFAVFRIVGG